MLTLKIKDPEKLLPGEREIVEAARRGVEVLVIEHLRRKNDSTSPKPGFPKSNYYANAAKDVASSVSGSKATVEINHPGVALHFFGGTVLPKKKALAIPLEGIVWDVWPSEYQGELHPVKDKKTGKAYLVDDSLGLALYELVPKVAIPSDPSVLPTDEEILTAAEAAVWEMVA